MLTLPKTAKKMAPPHPWEVAWKIVARSIVQEEPCRRRATVRPTQPACPPPAKAPPLW